MERSIVWVHLILCKNGDKKATPLIRGSILWENAGKKATPRKTVNPWLNTVRERWQEGNTVNPWLNTVRECCQEGHTKQNSESLAQYCERTLARKPHQAKQWILGSIMWKNADKKATPRKTVNPWLNTVRERCQESHTMEKWIRGSAHFQFYHFITHIFLLPWILDNWPEIWKRLYFLSAVLLCLVS